MSCVHYKFSSKLDYSAVTFQGLYITLGDLKRQIMARERLKATCCDLQIINQQTQEEYTDDEAHISRLLTVIVRRIPVVRDGSDKAVVGSSRPMDSSSSSSSLVQLAKMANLVDENASEEDKIKAIISQSKQEYDPIHYSKKAVGPPPPNYICHRCGKADHYIQKCPMLPVKISKGIPRSFMVKAEAGTKGAMVTSTGEYAIPAINAEAYAQKKKERPPFIPHGQSSSKNDAEPIPAELLCPICNDLMTDAAVILCCRSSYCDDCIRTFLLDSEEHICFTCQQSGVSPDSLTANKCLRQVIINFKNKTCYTKPGREQLQQVAPPPPRPQLVRPLHSRQRDPLMPNVTPPPLTSAPTPAPQVQAPHCPSPALYAPPPQPYLLPYTSGHGLIPPPALSYQPQTVFAPGPPGLNPCHNGRSYERSRSRSRSPSRSYGYRRSGLLRSPSYHRAGWEGAEGAGPYRSRSRSRCPGGFHNRSSGGRKPPSRDVGPCELKVPHHPPSSLHSTTFLKNKNLKRKRTDDAEQSQQSVKKSDATRGRDKSLDEIPSQSKMPPIHSRQPAGAAVSKAPASKSTLPHPSLHDLPRPGHDIRGRRDLPPGGGLLPHPHPHSHHHHPRPSPHGLLHLHRPPSPSDGQRRMEEGGSLLGPPPGKLRRKDGLGTGRKESSEDRTVPRERPRHAGERQHGSDKDQDRSSSSTPKVGMFTVFVNVIRTKNFFSLWKGVSPVSN